ncbi:MAG TPA: DUF3788 family protein, partial [Bacteroidales bacterium]
MSTSIFMDKAPKPGSRELQDALGETYGIWAEIREYIIKNYPKGVEEWNYSGAKYGWSFRIKDSKRAILYFLPRDKYFLVAFVYGQKATDQAITGNISKEIKELIKAAPVYAEGRGFRIQITGNETIP